MANGLVSRERQQTLTSLSGYPSCLMFISESPEKVILPADLNLGLPSPDTFTPGNATVYGRRPSGLGNVLLVLGTSSKSKVRAAVVETVSVSMISTTFTLLQSEKFSMQKESFAREVATIGFPVDVPVFVEVPTPLVHEGNIGSVDDRVSDDLTVCEDGKKYGILAVHLDDSWMPALDS